MPTEQKKKSKAPLIIGLCIGGIALIAVIVLAVLLLFGGKNKNKDSTDKTTTSTMEVESTSENTTTNNNSASDETETEIETTYIEDEILSDSDIISSTNDIAKAIMADVAKYKLKAIDKNLLKAVNDYLVSRGKSTTYVLDSLYECIIDSDDNLLSYTIDDVRVTDSTYYDDEKIEDILKTETNSFVEPTGFSRATVNVTYEEQTSAFHLYFCVCDNEVWLYDFNTDDFYIEFEDTESNNGSIEVSDTVSSMLSTNTKYLEAGSFNNTFNGTNYSLGLPNNWTVDTKSYDIPYIFVPNKNIYFSITSDPTYALVTPAQFMQSLYDIYVAKGFTNIEIGVLGTSNLSGQYISCEQTVNGVIWYTVQCIFKAPDGSCICISLFATDTNDADYSVALSSIASLKFSNAS